jgi:hypothetical protein
LYLSGVEYFFVNDPTVSLTSSGDYYGEVMTFGSGASTLGNCYYWGSTGWVATDADAAASSVGLLALATSSAGFDRGMLIRGFFKDTTWSWTQGNVLYLSTTAGKLTQTQPAGTGDIVRVVGYALSSDEIFFDPSQDWIELA